MGERDPELWEQEYNKCAHFTGIQNRTCAAGVPYELVSGHNGRLRTLACFRDEAKAAGGVTCEMAVWLTEAEARQREAETRERFRQFLEDLAAGNCPHCHAPGIRQVQVGCCIYAEPCGHRIGAAPPEGLG